MKPERRRELKKRARYFAAGMIENIEPIRLGQFDDLDPDGEEAALVQEELLRIGKRIYKGEN